MAVMAQEEIGQNYAKNANRTEEKLRPWEKGQNGEIDGGHTRT